MLKSVSICAALILAVAVFADSAEARQGFGGRMGGMSGFKGMSGAGPARMGMTGPARMGMTRPMGMGAGSTGSALRAVRPPNLHITPDVRRDLIYAASAMGSL
jgi:hypothetical protein